MQFNRRHSITSKLTLVLIIVFPGTMIMTGLYFYFVLSAILTENITKDLSQLVKETNDKIEYQLDMVDNAAMFIISNPEIKKNLLERGTSDSAFVSVQRKQAIEDQIGYSLFYNYAWESNLFESAYIFVDKENYYYLARYYRPEIYEDHLYIYRQFADKGMNLKLYPAEKNRILYLARNIKENNIKRSLGTIVIGIDEKLLESSYIDTLGYLNARVYIYDSSGSILSCNGNEKLGQKMETELLDLEEMKGIRTVKIENKPFYTTTYSIDRFQIKTLILIPQKELFSSFTKSLSFYMLVIIIGIIIAALLGIALSSQITKSLKNMVSNINKFKSGDFSVKMPVYREFELNELSSVFNKMTDEIQNLFKEIYEKQLLIKESELKLLQSQVNPHFLFNVLDVISWEARISKNDKVYEMITSLGQLMIANISFSSKEKLTVLQELEYIEFYLFLQKMRFGEKLIITINIREEKIRSFYIPKFCVYTVVENAIVHGLENRIGEKVLIVTGKVEDNELIFRVEDNGIGFDPSTIDLDSPKEPQINWKGHTNIGLYNANKRIQLLYGKKYGITLKSESGLGSIVTIKLPIDQEDN